jgi:hypothetical protein
VAPEPKQAKKKKGERVAKVVDAAGDVWRNELKGEFAPFRSCVRRLHTI